MSQVSISPKEAEVDNLFSKLGFFTRAHIQIFPSDFKASASDIDVLAVEFNPYLIPEFNIIEVKEGPAKITTLFQLYGFKTYFGNCNAYYVAREIYGTTLEISRRLGIRTLSHDRLVSLVGQQLRRAKERKRISVDLETTHLGSVINYLSAIRQMDPELFWRYHYLWLEKNPYDKFYQLQRLFGKVRKLESSEEPARKATAWYKREIFILALLSLCLMAQDCIDIDSAGIFPYVEDRFYNIGTSKEGKLKVEKGISILVEQIEKLSHGLIKAPMVEILPSYVEDLARLVKLLVKDAAYAQSYLSIDNNVHRTNLREESKNLKEFTTSEFQYQRMRELNGLLLDILYEGDPIEVVFNDFV